MHMINIFNLKNSLLVLVFDYDVVIDNKSEDNIHLL